MRKLKRIMATSLSALILCTMFTVPVKAAETETDAADDIIICENDDALVSSTSTSVSDNVAKLKKIIEAKGYGEYVVKGFEVNGMECFARQYSQAGYADLIFYYYPINGVSTDVKMYVEYDGNNLEVKSILVNLSDSLGGYVELDGFDFTTYIGAEEFTFKDEDKYTGGCWSGSKFTKDERKAANNKIKDAFSAWQIYLQTECSSSLQEIGFVSYKGALELMDAECSYVAKATGGKWDGTSYINPNGQLVKNAFFSDGEYTYFLDCYGKAMKDRLTYHPDGVHVIYFDENGHEVFSDFHHVKKAIAGNAVDDYCFFDVYGYMYVDVMTYDKTGKKLYYVNPYGQIERNGWFKFSSTAVWAGTTKKVGTGWGYGQSDGTLMINRWTKNKVGKKVYMQGDGHMK